MNTPFTKITLSLALLTAVLAPAAHAAPRDDDDYRGEERSRYTTRDTRPDSYRDDDRRYDDRTDYDRGDRYDRNDRYDSYDRDGYRGRGDTAPIPGSGRCWRAG